MRTAVKPDAAPEYTKIKDRPPVGISINGIHPGIPGQGIVVALLMTREEILIQEFYLLLSQERGDSSDCAPGA